VKETTDEVASVSVKIKKTNKPDKCNGCPRRTCSLSLQRKLSKQFSNTY